MSLPKLFFIIFFCCSWLVHFSNDHANDDDDTIDIYLKNHDSELIRNIGSKWLTITNREAEINKTLELLNRVNETASKEEIIILNFYLSKLHLKSNNINASYSCLESVYPLVDDLSNTLLKVHFYRNLGRLLYKADAYELSIRYLKRAKSQINEKNLNDLKVLINIEIRIANNYSKLNEHSRALQILNNLNIKYQDNNDVNFRSKILYELADAHYMADSLDRFYEFLNRSAKLLKVENSKDSIRHVQIIKRKGDYFFIQKDYEAAMNYYLQSYSFNRSYNDRYKINTSISKLLRLTETAWHLNDFKSMEIFLNQADSLVVNNVNVDIKQNYVKRSKQYWKLHYEKKGNNKSLKKYYKYVDLADNISSKKEQLLRLANKNYFETREQELSSNMELIKANSDLLLVRKKLIQRIALIIILILVVILISLVLYFKLRHKIQEMNFKVSETDRKIAEIELKNVKLKEQNLKQEISLKNSELTNLRAANTVKIKTTEYLLQNINELLSKREISIVDFKQFSYQLENQLNREKKLAVLQNDTEMLDSGFLERLKDKHSNLSKTEREHCVYIRLNMSIKEIAELLGMTNSSLRVARHRIRKKLNLERSDELVKIIQSI